MRAITVSPGIPFSARLDNIDEPAPSDGVILVRTLALGVCGTDAEIVRGAYGWAPPGSDRLVLGHESLGQVISAPPTSGFQAGDLVVGIVRRPDPVPCPACAHGEWDMCRNGRYAERGIKERHGFGAERFRIETDYAVRIAPSLGRLGVLLEPASIVAKAWDHIQRIGQRTRTWQPKTLLVSGAGPIGLLAAMMGAQRGLDVHVLDRNVAGPKPALVRKLGGTYHAGSGEVEFAPDLWIECTGAASMIAAALAGTAAAGITCLTGVSRGGDAAPVDLGAVNRDAVLTNSVVFGTVNANRAHYQMAAEALAKADPEWLAMLITRRVPVGRFAEALERRPGDVKVVVDFTL